jgi:S-adenosyl-L-methionine hydrolase (adenosine-forming)
MLRDSFSFFPEGTVHLAVVDPGVGTGRRALAMSAGGHLFVAPDNGLLSYVAEAHPPLHTVEITARRYLREPVSATFHGRDVFAPVAARLASGLPLEELGGAAGEICRLEAPFLSIEAAAITGEVLYADHFGNITTSITAGCLENKKIKEIRLNTLRLPGLSRDYEKAGKGEPLAIVNSAGNLEIAISSGNAQKETGGVPGDRIVITYE